MRIDLACRVCVFSNRPSLFQMDVRDDGIYTITCDLGHTTTTIVQQHPFEVLSQVGANAIVDGYYREAVSAFSASLERFYEFAFHVLLRHFKYKSALFDTAWKPISKLSERQLGAFVASWTIAFGSAPEVLPDNGKLSRQFRNDVIHNGKIPARDDAIAYGQLIIGMIRSQIAELKALNEDAVHAVVSNRLHGIRSKANIVGASTLCMSTVVSLSDGTPPADLVEHLSRIQSMRSAFDVARTAIANHNKKPPPASRMAGASADFSD